MFRSCSVNVGINKKRESDLESFQKIEAINETTQQYIGGGLQLSKPQVKETNEIFFDEQNSSTTTNFRYLKVLNSCSLKQLFERITGIFH